VVVGAVVVVAVVVCVVVVVSVVVGGGGGGDVVVWRFPVERPLPKTLVSKLVIARLSEIRRPQ
jgi:hypothetical protein